MPTKQFVEKQISKEISKEKEIAKDKHEKEKAEKEKHEKNETKESKDAKDTPDKQHKEKAEKEKHEKEQKEVKEHKDKTEKHETKEHSKEISEKQLIESVHGAPGMPEEASQQDVSPAKVVEKAPEKAIHTDKVKIEVLEKFFKHEKFEKHEIIEHKALIDVPVRIPTVPIPDPGPVEDRLAALEAAYAQLSHFIPQELRPDLIKGALKQEPQPDADDKPKTEPVKEQEKGKK